MNKKEDTVESQQETSITVKEAAKRIGYSVRQTDRFIKDGELEAIHVNRSLRKVPIASVDAFNARHNRRPVDPLEHIKDTLHHQEQVDGEILRQLALLRSEVEAREQARDRKYSDMEGQLRIVKAQLQQEREVRQRLEQAVATLSMGIPAAEGTQHPSDELLRQLLSRLPRASQRRQLPQEKRGFGPDTIRLVHFAVQHSIEPSTLRQHAEKTPGLATVYERPNATTKKHEWWLLPEQQQPLLDYWQAQNKPWTPCPDCPHGLLGEETTKGKTAIEGTQVPPTHNISA
jgi:excisionase family DNA binding protein